MSKSEDNYIKIILLGDEGTGKTNLIKVYLGFEFGNNTLSTLAPESYQKELNINNKNYLINIWDTAGQEKYRAITNIFINDSKIVIFVYDITMPHTFKNLKFWLEIVEEKLGKEPILGLVANKMDLFENQKVSKLEGQQYAKEIGALFCETSAKIYSQGFRDFVKKLVEELLVQKGIIEKNKDEGKINLDDKPKGNKKCPCNK